MCPIVVLFPASVAPPVVCEYLISIELNISDVTLINQLRTTLSNVSYPISNSNHIQIYDINTSTGSSNFCTHTVVAVVSNNCLFFLMLWKWSKIRSLLSKKWCLPVQMWGSVSLVMLPMFTVWILWQHHCWHMWMHQCYPSWWTILPVYWPAQ